MDRVLRFVNGFINPRPPTPIIGHDATVSHLTFLALLRDRHARWAGSRAKRRAEQEPLLLGIAHDNPAVTPASHLRFDCCVALADDVRRGESDIGIQTVLGGHYATAVHQGSFTTLAQTYRWLARDVLPQEQLVLRPAPAVEIYLTPPDTGATDGITEVLLPV